MKDAIAHCFQKDGLLEEARLPATYQRALLVLTEAPIVPDEVEVEEDLGPVEDEAVPELEDNQFDIEIIQDDFGDRASDDEVYIKLIILQFWNSFILDRSEIFLNLYFIWHDWCFSQY